MMNSDVLWKLWVKDQENITLLSELTSALFAERRLDEIDDLLQNLSAKNATSPFVLLTKIQLKLLRQDWSGFDALVSIYHGDLQNEPAFSQLLAQKHFILRDFEQALAVLKPFLTVSEAHMALAARCLYMQGNIDQALNLVDLFMQQNQISESGTAGLYALMLADTGQAGIAQQWAAQTLQHNPDQVDALVAEAYLMIDAQQYEKADTVLQHGLMVAPGIGRLWSMHGQVLMVQNQIPAALDALEKATVLMPEHVGTWLLKGWCQWLSGDYPASEQSFTQALALDRNFADSHGALAVVQLQLGDRAAAELSLAKARRLDRESFSVAFADSLLLEIDGSADLAAEKIRQKLASPHYSGIGSYQDVIAKRLAR